MVAESVIDELLVGAAGGAGPTAGAGALGEVEVGAPELGAAGAVGAAGLGATFLCLGVSGSTKGPF